MTIDNKDFELAQKYLLNNNIKDAVNIYNRCVAEIPDNPNTLILGGRIDGALGRHESAVSLFRKSALIVPQSPAVHFFIAYHLWQMYRPEEVFSHLCRCLELAPQFEPARQLYPRVLREIGIMKSSPLLRYRENVNSQNGEDGVLREILSRLNIQRDWFCEFGAWDGKHLSNTFNLAVLGWPGVFIEGDPAKYNDLLSTCATFPKRQIDPINAFVDYEKPELSLDTLLQRTPIPSDFGVLSIDIDSTDYLVWESLRLYRPKIVIIEIISTLPVDAHKICTRESAGSSFLPTVLLGKRLGYDPVCHTGNIIFVRNDLSGRLGLPAEVFDHPEKLYLTSRFHNI